MHNLYEIILFVHPKETLESVNSLTNEFCDIVKKNGKNIFLKVISKKKLAWVRKKQLFATLIYHKFVSTPQVVRKYEEDLKSIEMCLLKQIILIEKDVRHSSYVEMSDKSYLVSTNSEECNFIDEISETSVSS